MNEFAQLAAADQRIAFDQVALRRQSSAVVVEKDFWVCWLLALLFDTPALAPHLVFKGGTSLSKVYGLIDRFSEDIDLSISPAFVGVDVQAFDALTSRAGRDAAMQDMQTRCDHVTRKTIAPLLEMRIREVLGVPAERDAWLRHEVDPQMHSPILYFRYPSALAVGFDYIRREVKLELGSLTDQQPVDTYPVHAWVADVFPALFENWRCHVVTLGIGRAFWEKATILHAEYHRPAEKTMPDRYARHYADTACLLTHPDAEIFLRDTALCARVVDWKNRVFASGWARYDLARPGTFRLLPPDHRRQALTRDYAAMRPMFMHEPPAFDTVLARLAEAERVINQEMAS